MDFSYEVGRSLAACEGALIVVDVGQGVEAQTLSNVYMALDNDLEILPVLNKIDLLHADADGVQREIEEIIGLDAREANRISAKSGEGVPGLLESIVSKIPPPSGQGDHPLQALIFDSWFDAYQGVVVLVRIVEGSIGIKDKVYFKYSKEQYDVLKLGVNAPFFTEVEHLGAGEVGLLICGIKTVRNVSIGDTIVNASKKDTPNLPGFKEVKPMVFCGIFPVDSSDYETLKESLEKLSLNDASFSYELEQSQALGFGYRCGLLGLLHLNIIQERLEREFKLNLITTAPSCRYKVRTTKGEEVMVDNPSRLPDMGLVENISGPMVELTIHVPQDFLGQVIRLCSERRGRQKEIKYITTERVQLTYDLPLNEMVFDFHDRLKSMSKGYASMDYEFIGYEVSKLVKLDILLNGEKVDALSLICHGDNAYGRGRTLAKRLQKVIARQQFDIIIQAAVGAKILARETVKALRKNVLAKCYGGDITRKRKLLEKQKAGKKRMKMVGSVEVPQEAFLSILKVGDDE